MTASISRVLVGQHLRSKTSQTCCNLSRKCTSVKYKKRQKAGFLIITYGSACNSKQKWNNYKCWCEHKELDDWSSCKDDYM